MITCDISVLLLSYNPSEDELRRSIRSISQQEDCSFQLLVVDDCSQINPSQFVTDLIRQYPVHDWAYIRNAHNMKTVHSVRNALRQVTGKYVKLLGAGDELYDHSTLKAIADFCKTYDSQCGFGNIVLCKDGVSYDAPRNKVEYPPAGNASRKHLFKNQIEHADWIPGCAQFYETRFLARMLEQLSDYYHVDFCEDFSETIALLETDVFHLDTPIVKYDWGGGISANGSLSSRTRLYQDHTNFFSHLRQEKPFGLSLTFSYAVFRIKKFIALRTPIYPFLQKIYAKTHRGSQS